MVGVEKITGPEIPKDSLERIVNYGVRFLEYARGEAPEPENPGEVYDLDIEIQSGNYKFFLPFYNILDLDTDETDQAQLLEDMLGQVSENPALTEMHSQVIQSMYANAGQEERQRWFQGVEDASDGDSGEINYIVTQEGLLKSLEFVFDGLRQNALAKHVSETWESYFSETARKTGTLPTQESFFNIIERSVAQLSKEMYDNFSEEHEGTGIPLPEVKGYFTFSYDFKDAFTDAFTDQASDLSDDVLSDVFVDKVIIHPGSVALTHLDSKEIMRARELGKEEREQEYRQMSLDFASKILHDFTYTREHPLFEELYTEEAKKALDSNEDEADDAKELLSEEKQLCDYSDYFEIMLTPQGKKLLLEDGFNEFEGSEGKNYSIKSESLRSSLSREIYDALIGSEGHVCPDFIQAGFDDAQNPYVKEVNYCLKIDTKKSSKDIGTGFGTFSVEVPDTEGMDENETAEAFAKNITLSAYNTLLRDKVKRPEDEGRFNKYAEAQLMKVVKRTLPTMLEAEEGDRTFEVGYQICEFDPRIPAIDQITFGNYRFR